MRFRQLRSSFAGVPIILTMLVMLATVPVTHATPQYSIPINGRYATPTISLQIPSTPKWAHDLVLNTSLAWNQAQIWYQQSTAATDPSTQAVYTFVESSHASVTISFTMPSAFSGIAVGWTEYRFAPSSKTTIVSAQVYLDPTAFNQQQENNMTDRQYAFRLALHELGRVLGLGSVLDGQDIMDPRSTPARAQEPPMLSTLDLYAVHILASGNAPTFVTLPSGYQNELLDARSFLPGQNHPAPIPEFNAPFNLIIAICIGAFVCLHRKKRRVASFH